MLLVGALVAPVALMALLLAMDRVQLRLGGDQPAVAEPAAIEVPPVTVAA